MREGIDVPKVEEFEVVEEGLHPTAKYSSFLGMPSRSTLVATVIVFAPSSDLLYIICKLFLNTQISLAAMHGVSRKRGSSTRLFVNVGQILPSCRHFSPHGRESS